MRWLRALAALLPLLAALPAAGQGPGLPPLPEPGQFCDPALERRSASYRLLCNELGPQITTSDAGFLSSFLDKLQAAALGAGDSGLAAVSVLRRPAGCMLCLPVVAMLDVGFYIGPVAYGVLARPLLFMASAGFLAVFAWQLGAGLAGLRPLTWRTHAMGLAMLGGIGLLLGGAGIAGDAVFTDLFSGLLAPTVTFAAASGEVVLSTLDGLFTRAGAGGDTLSDQIARRMPGQMRYVEQVVGPAEGARLQLREALLSLILGMQEVCTLGLARGILYAVDLSGLDSPEGWTTFLIGFVLIFGFAVLLIVVGARLVEPLLRIAFAAVFLPLAVASLPFALLRRKVAFPLIRSVLYSAVWLFCIGVVYGVVLVFLVRALALSAGDPSLSYGQVFSMLSTRTVADASPGSPHSMLAPTMTLPTVAGAATTGRVVRFVEPLFILIALGLAIALIGLVPAIASSIVSGSASQDSATERSLTQAVGAPGSALRGLRGLRRLR